MANKVFQIVTNQIIEKLKEGVVPWDQPWKISFPKNMVSKKPYHGINLILLGFLEYGSPWFLTFKQIKELGGKVKKGSNSHLVVFWKIISKGTGEYDVETGKELVDSYPLLRYYRVFNVESTEGLEDKIPEEEKLEFTPIQAAEKILENYKGKPPITNNGNKAYYNPKQDQIGMPPKAKFKSVEHYYNTLFHELVHSTGHKKRLDRPQVSGLIDFGSHEYSKEELVAELGSAFLSAETGTKKEVIDNSASYIKGWLDKLESDDKFIIYASTQAQKAVDYIKGIIQQTY
jgi:antirestriction protein ArdC